MPDANSPTPLEVTNENQRTRAPEPEPPPVLAEAFDPTLSFCAAKERAIATWERWYVSQLMRHTRGNLSEAARVARSDRTHLRKLVRRHSSST